MTVKPTQLVDRTLIYAKIETTKGTDAVPTKAVDAFLVGSADISLDPTVLERDLYRASFSPLPGMVGRKVVNVTFNHEIKGSGANGVRPKLGTLLRACGMQETLITAGAATQIADPFAEGAIVGAEVAWAKDTAPTSHFGSYLVEVVTGGASLAAAVQVTRWEQGEYDAAVGINTRVQVSTNASATATMALDVTDPTAPEITIGGTLTVGDLLFAVIQGETFRLRVTAAHADVDALATAMAALIDADARFTASATAGVITVGYAGAAEPIVLTSGTTEVPLGSSGAVIIPTWTGSLTKGQKWIVVLREEGYHYLPLTDQSLSESLTIYFFRDGNLHVITGAQGSVSFTGEAGNYGQAAFSFTGGFTEPLVEPLPATGIVYEQSQPPQVELAQMSIKGDKDFCAQSFTFDMANDINPRDCLNGPEGLNGSAITGRTPTASLNPEGSLEIYTNMWGDFARGAVLPLHLRVGKETNNIVRFYAGRASYTGLSYGDRNGTVTQEPTWQLNGLSPDGDDEIRVVFPQS